MKRIANDRTKRVFDVVVATVLLVLTSLFAAFLCYLLLRAGW